MKKPPPVPQDNRSPKGPGSDPKPDTGVRPRGKGPPNAREQGQTANTRQNTTNQGYQQDR